MNWDAGQQQTDVGFLFASPIVFCKVSSRRSELSARDAIPELSFVEEARSIKESIATTLNACIFKSMVLTQSNFIDML